MGDALYFVSRKDIGSSKQPPLPEKVSGPSIGVDVHATVRKITRNCERSDWLGRWKPRSFNIRHRLMPYRASGVFNDIVDAEENVKDKWYWLNYDTE